MDNKKLALEKLIKDNPDKWEEILTNEPYCLDVNKDQDFVCLSYNQIKSEMSLPECQEARGIIFDLGTLDPVCIPFFKFWNHGDSKCAQIDWATARVEQKMDGSIIKVWFSHRLDKWMISTNGCVNAFKATLAPNPVYATFGDLVMSIFVNKYGMDEDFGFPFDKDYTYMFEVTSLFNRVVLEHKVPDVTFLGKRNNITLQEEKSEPIMIQGWKDYIRCPESFDLKSAEQVIAKAEQYTGEQEGFVVVDANFNRCKIKSSFYVHLHQSKNNGAITVERVVDMIQKEKLDEFVAYFDGEKTIADFCNKVLKTVQNYTGSMATAQGIVCRMVKEGCSRKDIAISLAQYANDAKWYGFTILDRNSKTNFPLECNNPYTDLMKMDASKVAKFLNMDGKNA
jgi:hypothetical protein